MLNRLELFEKALKLAVIDAQYPYSPTGMYRCVSYEYCKDGDFFGEQEVLNICAICLFLEDAPYNYGDKISPTSYDGDCDDCGGESIFYSLGDDTLE